MVATARGHPALTSTIIPATPIITITGIMVTLQFRRPLSRSIRFAV